MLQKVDSEANLQEHQQDLGYLLRPAFYWKLIKRRWAVFLLPFVFVASVGVGGVMLWPATYLSAGRILVQSQQIPTELVRPTVTSAAQERIQVLEQRTMTRDNLLAIADKFKLFPEKRQLMSVTELVELMKKNVKIEAVDLDLDFKQQRSRMENPTIVFSVGFEHPDPETAARVANELVTRILNEDLRDRTSRASETTRFLARDVQKLQAENALLDTKISQLRLAQGVPAGRAGADKPATLLSQLKADLVQRSALYSDKHPLIQTLKRQIEALEKSAAVPADPDSKAVDPNGTASIDALVAQQEALQKNLDVASEKLNAAQLGESLEKDQQSEKLEVIEQPTTPQEPIKPKRLKLSGMALVLALAAGAGTTFLAEFMDKGIRRASDIFSLIDSKLVVSIPYITTSAELRRRRRRVIFSIAAFVVILIFVVIAALLFLPPLDLIIAKARVGLFR
jgi:uncharacterized protein involved in exopolysaccharide biosynthesis